MMSNNVRCVARQYSDQMSCGRCALTWDMNDPEPPECGAVTRRLKRTATERAHRKAMTILRALLNN